MTVYGIFLCNQTGRLVNQQLQAAVPTVETLQTPLQLPGGPWQRHATKIPTTWEFTGQNQTLTRLLVPITIDTMALAEPDQPVSLILTTKAVNHHVAIHKATLLTPAQAHQQVDACWQHALRAAAPAYPVSYGKQTPHSQVRKFWYQPAPHTCVNVIILDYDHLPLISQP